MTCSVVDEPAAPAGVRGDQHPPHVGRRGAGPGDPRPVPVALHQRRLHEVLRMAAVAGEEDRETQEARLLRGHEVREGLVVLGAHGGPLCRFLTPTRIGSRAIGPTAGASDFRTTGSGAGEAQVGQRRRDGVLVQEVEDEQPVHEHARGGSAAGRPRAAGEGRPPGGAGRPAGRGARLRCSPATSSRAPQAAQAARLVLQRRHRQRHPVAPADAGQERQLPPGKRLGEPQGGAIRSTSRSGETTASASR